MAGQVCESFTSQPFGDNFAKGGTTGVAACDPSPQFFTGKPRDTESNLDDLDDFGARYFSSQWGRWMSPDWSAKPAGVPYSSFSNPQSLNLYGYVGNDPITGEDPDGHLTFGFGDGYNDGDNQKPGGENSSSTPASATSQTVQNSSGDTAVIPTPTTTITVNGNDGSALPSLASGLIFTTGQIALEGAGDTSGLCATGGGCVVPAALLITGAALLTVDYFYNKSHQDANAPRSDLPRAANGDYLPDPNAQGAHSTTGTRTGGNGKPYRQGATFDEKGKFKGRTDVTDHGRPQNHPDPHFHPATSSNGVGPAEALPSN